MSTSKNYDLIIVGAGIIGSALFYEATKSGLRALLIEKSKVGGSTSGEAGGLIHQIDQTNPVEYGFNYYQNFKQQTGYEIQRKQVKLHYHANGNREIDQEAFCIHPVEACQAWVQAGIDLGGDFSFSSRDTFSSSRGLTAGSIMRSTKGIIDPVVKHFLGLDPVSRNDERKKPQSNETIILTCGSALPKLLNKYQLTLKEPLVKKAFQYNLYSTCSKKQAAVIDVDNDFYSVPSIHRGLIAGLLFQDQLLEQDEKPEFDESLARQIDQKLELYSQLPDLFSSSLRTPEPSDQFSLNPRLRRNAKLFVNDRRIATDSFTAQEKPLIQKTNQANIWVAGGGSGVGIKYAPWLAKQAIANFLRL